MRRERTRFNPGRPQSSPFRLLCLCLVLVVCQIGCAFHIVTPNARLRPARRPDSAALASRRLTRIYSSSQDEPKTDGSTEEPAVVPQRRLKDEAANPREYMFGRPGELDNDLRLLGTSRRRLLVSTSAALMLALGADFLGITRSLLSLLPQETIDNSKIDRVFAARGFKRHVDEEDEYEFRYPQSWLADQAVLLAEARERTAAAVGPYNPADPTTDPFTAQGGVIRINARQTPRKGRGVRPDVAYGPAGGDRNENVSVVKSKVAPGFSLQGTLGEPREAAQTLIDTALAPQGSGRQATLIGATSRITPSGGLVYEFEIVVQPARGPALHNLCVVTARPSENTLFTLTVLTPQDRWTKSEAQLREVAKSFQLLRV